MRFALAVPVGLALFFRMPFPEENDLLQLVLLQKPYLFYGIEWAYVAMLFTTPYIAASLLFSLAYIFLLDVAAANIKVPPGKQLVGKGQVVSVVVAVADDAAELTGAIKRQRQPAAPAK